MIGVANQRLSFELAVPKTLKLCMVQVELEEQLVQAGPLGSTSSLKAALVSMMGGKAALGKRVISACAVHPGTHSGLPLVLHLLLSDESTA